MGCVHCDPCMGRGRECVPLPGVHPPGGKCCLHVLSRGPHTAYLLCLPSFTLNCVPKRYLSCCREVKMILLRNISDVLRSLEEEPANTLYARHINAFYYLTFAWTQLLLGSPGHDHPDVVDSPPGWLTTLRSHSICVYPQTAHLIDSGVLTFT